MGFKVAPKEINIAHTLMERDYKGVSNQAMTIVRVRDGNKTDNRRYAEKPGMEK